MTLELITVLSLLSLAVIAFVRNKPRMDVVALIAIVVLPTIHKVLPIEPLVSLEEALQGFSDSSVILVAAFFVIGTGLVRTGIAYRVGDWLIKKAKNDEIRLVVFLMLAVALLGSVMSSTGVVAIFIPIVLSIAVKMNLSPSGLMMPLSFAGLISGMLTLVSTAPNLVVSSGLEQAGYDPLGFFSVTPIGLSMLVVGVFYMLFARRFLKKGAKSTGVAQKGRRNLYDFIRDYKLTGRNRRIRVNKGSPFIGKTIKQLNLRVLYGANIIAIERASRFTHDIIDAMPDREIREDDILLMDFFYQDRVGEFCKKFGLSTVPFSGDYFTDQSRTIGMVEVAIPPESSLIDKTIYESAFRSTYHLNVVGLRRNRESLEKELLDEKLKSGDTLLVIGTWQAIKKLQTLNQDFLVLSVPAEVDEVAPAMSRAPFAVLALIITISLMISGVIPNVIAALIGCLLMGAFRCIDMESAYQSIHWQSLILIVGMFPFALALENTGGIDMAVEGLLNIFGDSNPRLIMGALFALAATIGLFVSNTATALLLAPIAINVAQQVDASPYPFAMAIIVAASGAFMTPVSSPVNTLVVAPGGYNFFDFVKIGVPFTLIVMVITVALVPIIFPF